MVSDQHDWYFCLCSDHKTSHAYRNMATISSPRGDTEEWMNCLLRLSLLFLFYPTWLSAADVNGYAARYECRAGGEFCNVDVVTLTAAACAQTITTADSEETIESKLNTGSS